MKKTALLLLFLLSYNLVACSSNKTDTGSALEAATENGFNSEEAVTEPDTQDFTELEEDTGKEVEKEAENTEDLFSVLGFPVLLPENPNWIKDAEYYQPKEDSLEIHYYDDILGGDCILFADKESISDLSDNTYDESSEETWMGDTASGQRVYVKVQRSADGLTVIAYWEYNDYQFAIQGNVPDNMADASPIPKTALYVIGKFESQ